VSGDARNTATADDNGELAYRIVRRHAQKLSPRRFVLSIHLHVEAWIQVSRCAYSAPSVEAVDEIPRSDCWLILYTISVPERLTVRRYYF